ncbi:hypothetical protein ACX0G9_31165 [Flavitalea flava]
MRIKVLFARCSIFMLLLGCQPGGSPPDRKKMPEYAADYSLEGPPPFQGSMKEEETPGFGFQTSDIVLKVNGNMEGFVYVPLPDPANDSLAISLLRSYKTFALPLLETWAQQQHKGVAIDLSSHGNQPSHRADYVLEKPNDFSIPVVIIWDESSAARASALKSLVRELPSVTLRSGGK